MRKALTIFLLLITLAAQAIAVPQEDPKQHFFQLQSDKPVFSTIREGLASPQCRTIMQDSKGYTWIGTTNGVTRFDGAETITFGRSPNNNNNFDHSVIYLTEDTLSNCIWASFSKSRYLLRIDLNTFETTKLDYDLSFVDNNKSNMKVIYGIYPLTDSTLLCRTRHCYCTINKETGYGKLVKRNNKKTRTPLSKFIHIEGTDMNVCDGVLQTFSAPTKNGFPHIRIIDVPDTSGRNVIIRDISQMTDTTLAVLAFADTSEFNLFEFNINSRKSKFLTKCIAPHGIASADDGIWIASYRGLFFFRKADSRTFHFTTGNSTLHDNDLTCIYKLRQQPIFFIGSNDGLIKLDYYASIFEHTDMRRYSPSKDAQAWSITKDTQGNQWIGCVDGLFYRSVNNVYFKNIDNGLPYRNANNWVLEIEETKEKDLIIAAYSRRVLAFDHDGNFVCRLVDNSNPQGALNANVIRSLQTLPGGRFIYVLDNCIVIADTHTGKKLHVIEAQQKNLFRYVHTDDYKTAWISCRDATLRRLDLETLKMTIEEDKLGEHTISTIRHSTKNGVDELWMTTTNGALLYKNPGIKGIRHIKEGVLASQVVRSIEIDNRGNLWVGTHGGLVEINDAKITYFSAGKFDICHQFLNRSSSIGPEGQILMGGKYDFIEFSPQKIYYNDYYPAPTISSYVLSNSVRKDYDVMIGHVFPYPGGDVVVPAGTRSIQLKTLTLNYTGNFNNLEWRLDDSDTWNQTGPDGTVSLTHLSEGDHTLYLRPIDINDKPVKKAVAAFIIRKEVFFYETRAFSAIIITLTIVSMILAALYQYKRNKRIQEKLSTDLSTMSGMLIIANKELRDNQAIIQKQNEDLANANAILEKTVAERTRELEDAKEKAEESSQLKSSFLASLGHEVRTPMNAIVGFAKLLQDEKISPDERTEFAHLILESSNSMLSLMGSLLDTSRIERGVMEVTIADIDVYREISDTWKMLSVEKKYGGVEFRLDINDNLRGQLLATDKDRLRQIIINLTYNAFKFTQNGSVVISAEKISAHDLYQLNILPPDTQLPAQYLMLVSVADTGIGIPDDKTEAIFEPFRRLNANKLKYGGLGLGLNIVRSLTQLLGGRVWVKSQLGIGSTFFFYLPFGLKKEK